MSVRSSYTLHSMRSEGAFHFACRGLRLSTKGLFGWGLGVSYSFVACPVDFGSSLDPVSVNRHLTCCSRVDARLSHA